MLYKHKVANQTALRRLIRIFSDNFLDGGGGGGGGGLAGQICTYARTKDCTLNSVLDTLNLIPLSKSNSFHCT